MDSLLFYLLLLPSGPQIHECVTLHRILHT